MAKRQKPILFSGDSNPDSFTTTDPMQELTEQFRKGLSPRQHLVVGRSSACDFQFDRPEISRCHVRFFREPQCGKLLMVDLGSKNGTFLYRPLRQNQSVGWPYDVTNLKHLLRLQYSNTPGKTISLSEKGEQAFLSGGLTRRADNNSLCSNAFLLDSAEGHFDLEKQKDQSPIKLEIERTAGGISVKLLSQEGLIGLFQRCPEEIPFVLQSGDIVYLAKDVCHLKIPELPS